MRHREIVARWLPVVVWAACISSFSSGWFTGQRTGSLLLPLLATLFPSARLEELVAVHYVVRKLAHFTEYLLLSALLYRALRSGTGWSRRAAALALSISALYAAGDEFHQWFVPGRTAAAGDCLIDVSGAAAGQSLIAAWAKRRAGEPVVAVTRRGDLSDASGQ